MKVKELISFLKNYDDDLQIGFLNDEFQVFGSISMVELRDIELSDHWTQSDDESLGKKFIGIR